MTEPLEQFRAAIHAAGLTAPEAIEADGKLHRFQSNGKAGDDAGWYVLHLNGTPAGIFGDWRSGTSETWKAEGGRKLTKDEAALQRAAIEAMRRERDAEERAGHEAAATKAADMWQAAQPASEDHGYLRRKGIKPHGARVGADGRLLIPMRDTDGKLWNIERIAPEKPADGGTDKKGLYQGKRTGCYFAIGNPEGAAALCIVEGFATGASIHAATGYPVAVAFNAGNLAPVAKALRHKFPVLPLVICADDDWRTEGNPGRTEGEAAAKAVGGLMVLPVFEGERGEKTTDFNDLHQDEGTEAVRRIVGAAVASITGHGGEHQRAPETAPAGDSDGTAGDSGAFPGIEARPGSACLMIGWNMVAKSTVLACGISARGRRATIRRY